MCVLIVQAVRLFSLPSVPLPLQPNQPAFFTAARTVQRFATAALLLGLPMAAAAAAGVFGGSRGLTLPAVQQRGGLMGGSERQAVVAGRAGSGIEQQQQQQQQEGGVRGRGGVLRCAQPANSSLLVPLLLLEL
eukprot:1160024-Pelagomonas_calceolata.AAC.4